MQLRFSAALASLIVLGAASCSSTQSSVSVESTVTPYEMAIQSGEAYTMVVMRRGDGMESLSADELRELTVEHLGFMSDMMSSKMMLTAGASTAPRAEPNLRNISFFGTSNVDEVFAQMCSNPAAEAGVLTVEAIPFISDANLRTIPGVERGLSVERGTAGSGMRPYVIVQVPTSVGMTAMIDRMDDRVIFSGDCAGGSFEGSTLMVMDCQTAGEARELMAVLGEGADDCVYHPWVASTSLAGTN